jgi:hypothetical protein
MGNNLTSLQTERISDCVSKLLSLADPNKWKNDPGFLPLVRSIVISVKNGLENVGVKNIDLIKAIECIDYARPDLAYKYLFESSSVIDVMSGQLSSKYGDGYKDGAYKDLHSLIV